MIKVLDIKKLLILSLFSISVIYYIFLPLDKIMQIVKDEYIIIGICIVLFIVLSYYRFKLKGFTLVPYLVNTEVVSLKSTILIFVVLQGVDFYYEDGFIGMIKLWFTYWSFAVLAYLFTNFINIYKNFRFYKYESIKEHNL